MVTTTTHTVIRGTRATKDTRAPEQGKCGQGRTVRTLTFLRGCKKCKRGQSEGLGERLSGSKIDRVGE